MASPVAEMTLKEIYTRVRRSSPRAILVLPQGYTQRDLKVAHRALAIRLHPDKCSVDLRDLHTELFKRVQTAYELLLELNQIPSATPHKADPKDDEESSATSDSEDDEGSSATSDQADSEDEEYPCFGPEPPFTSGWSARDFGRTFRAMDEMMAQDEPMWERIKRPTFPRTKTPLMSKKAAVRVQRVRQERCVEYEKFLMRHGNDMRLWEMAGAKSKLRERRAFLQARMKEDQSSSGNEREQAREA